MVVKYISLILGALLEVYSVNIFISSFLDKRITKQKSNYLHLYYYLDLSNYNIFFISRINFIIMFNNNGFLIKPNFLNQNNILS